MIKKVMNYLKGLVRSLKVSSSPDFSDNSKFEGSIGGISKLISSSPDTLSERVAYFEYEIEAEISSLSVTIELAQQEFNVAIANIKRVNIEIVHAQESYNDEIVKLKKIRKERNIDQIEKETIRLISTKKYIDNLIRRRLDEYVEPISQANEKLLSKLCSCRAMNEQAINDIKLEHELCLVEIQKLPLQGISDINIENLIEVKLPSLVEKLQQSITNWTTRIQKVEAETLQALCFDTSGNDKEEQSVNIDINAKSQKPVDDSQNNQKGEDAIDGKGKSDE